MVSQLAPVRRTTLSGEVAARLAEVIRSGELAPGSRLPSERELGSRFGVGRTSIREAMRILQATGLVTVRPGDGIFVAESLSAEGEPFARWESQYRYRVEELFEARLAIEPMAAARAATRAEEEDLRALESTLLDLERGIAEGDLASMVLADSAFHNAVARASRNRLFQSMLKAAHHLMIASQRAGLGPHERQPRVLAMHRAVYDAIVARDAEAAERAMRAHLMSFVNDMGGVDTSFIEGEP